nr:hypothetical protein Iba_chr11fCG10860 [Ipomoea batatas]
MATGMVFSTSSSPDPVSPPTERDNRPFVFSVEKTIVCSSLEETVFVRLLSTMEETNSLFVSPLKKTNELGSSPGEDEQSCSLLLQSWRRRSLFVFSVGGDDSGLVEEEDVPVMVE